ncbi:MAG TPA: AtpZ/AtpI family protein [Tepidisphaeraceae bacterium]|nr:AtpZ/AtpI family protein [Tepidisphaeraceae bacterium]
MAEPDPPEGGSGGGDFRGLAYGLQILVGVGLGYLVGLWLERRYGWSQAVVVGSLVGLAGGLYLLIKDAIRINKD